MQYKSVRSSSKVWFEKSISAIALFAGVLLFANTSWASLTITPVKSGSDNTSLSNVDSSPTAYYPTTTTGVDTADTAVPPVVPTTTQLADPSGTQALVFNITANTATYTPPSGSTATYNAYIMAFVQSTYTTSSFYPVPLAFFNASPGSGGAYQSCQNNCYLTGTGPTPAGTTYYFAVPYTAKATVQVGIYPSDLCYLYAGNQLNNAGAGAFCTGASGTTGAYAPQANYAQGLQLKFYIVLIPTSNISQITPQSTTDTNLGAISPTTDTSILNLSFQGVGGTIGTCPNESTQQIYFPSDQSIYFDTTLFQNQFVAPALTTSGNGRVAPVNSLLMTYTTATSAVSISPPPAVPAFSTSNVIARDIAFGNNSQLVTGFTNTMPPANPLYYNLGIYLRDYAGFVTTSANYAGTATNACPLNNVQAVEVQGFLKQSKCFIATAAFRSMDAAPVVMLRQFRDQVLLHSSLGQGFVDWYYRWSPPAAEWLMDHPEFRYPVLLALVPVEIIAWLCLRPLIFLCLVGASLVLFIALKKRMNLNMRGESV